MERIDKIISVASGVSRADARALIKKGLVSVNGAVIKNIGLKADEKNDIICSRGEKLCYSKFVYIMMNKPQGVISASEGGSEISSPQAGLTRIQPALFSLLMTVILHTVF